MPDSHSQPESKVPADQPTLLPIEEQSTQPMGGERGTRETTTTPVGQHCGDYELQEEIGRGGMGVVFKALHVPLQRTVALKMVLSGDLAGESEIRRFHREAEAAANLLHPNIVQVHEVGNLEGRPFYSMDFIEGISLAQRLKDGPLPGKTAAGYLITIARAIQHAHEQKILHRDLKPSNILIDSADAPHVTDFGLAKRLDQNATGQTRTGALLGTPSYMAPEQAMGNKNLTPGVDIYGLGALLYEMLTGRPPFKAETPLDTVLQVMESQPAPPRLLNPKIDRDLETICLKCLEKDPHRRYSSAEALAADLERYLAGDPITARSVNLVDRMALALGRSQYDVHFKAYGHMFLAFAVIVLLTEILVTVIILTDQPAILLPLTQWCRVMLLGAIFYFSRRGSLLPSNQAERLMCALWVGYILTCIFLGMTFRLQVGLPPGLEFKIYPSLAAVTGLAFFILGSSYWGGCYAFGIAFYFLSLLMTVDLRWSAVEFGALWALALTTIGIRLLRMAKIEEE